VTWLITFYSDRLEAEILSLPAGFVARIKATEGIARVLYCTVVDRRIVFLHQFVKKTDKTPPRELEVARVRMKEVKHG
jgi:phage-related protein